MFLIRSGRFAAAFLAWAVAASAGAPAGAAAKHRAEAQPRAIAIVVNGDELARDPAPRIVGGRVLVPVVRIYSALGITVERSGDTLVAEAPSRRITLTVGSRRATIERRTIMLETAVAEINGATYVPLRFVADSLGAQATYDSKAARVQVVSTVVGRTAGLEQHTSSGTTQINGTLSAVDLNSAPESVTVTGGGSARTIAITSDAKIVVQDVVTRTTTPASLSDLRPGDAVAIVLRRDGGVDQVIGRYASRSGPIAAVSSSAFVLQNGTVISPDRSTTVTLNGQTAVIGDLKVGDVATVRTNPETQEKRQIIVSRPVPPTPQAAGAVSIRDVTVSMRGALREGQAFTVTLNGTPGGRASFDIGTYVTGIAMTEGAPGVYTGRYTVPKGVNFARTSIYGHLSVGGQDAPRVEAPQNVAITTTPPQIVDVAPAGITVNNNKPGIYATYRSPTDVGIAASSVRLEVNGLDVTAAATRTDGFVTYMPAVALPDGTVRVSVTVSDNAGNTNTRSWEFVIRTR